MSVRVTLDNVVGVSHRNRTRIYDVCGSPLGTQCDECKDATVACGKQVIIGVMESEPDKYATLKLRDGTEITGRDIEVLL